MVKARKASQKPTIKPDVEGIRRALRPITDGHCRYTRYLASRQHNQPKTLEEFLQYNDFELFDLHTDPHKNNNLARKLEQYRQLIKELNDKMSALIEAKIGVD